MLSAGSSLPRRRPPRAHDTPGLVFPTSCRNSTVDPSQIWRTRRAWRILIRAERSRDQSATPAITLPPPESPRTRGQGEHHGSRCTIPAIRSPRGRPARHRVAGRRARPVEAPGGFLESATSTGVRLPGAATLPDRGTVHVSRALPHDRRPPDQRQRLRRQRLRQLRRLLLLEQHQQPRRQRHDADRSWRSTARKGGGGPTLFSYNKNTRRDAQPRAAVRRRQPVQLGDRRRLVLQRHPAERAVRQRRPAHAALRRASTSTLETVFDVASAGSAPTSTSGRCTRATTTACTRRRSATAGTYAMLGCVVYREDTRQLPYFAAKSATTTSARSTRAAAGW